MARHILIVTPGFPASERETDCIPPLQDFLLALACQFPSITCSVISLHYPHSTQPYGWNGFRVFPLGGAARGFPRRLDTWIRFIKIARKIHRMQPIDLIHCFWYNEAAFLGSWAARLMEVPLATTLMGQELRTANPYNSFISKKCHAIVAVSPFQQRDVQRRQPKLKIDRVIPWGIDPGQFHTNEKTIDVLGVGGLIPLKNFTLWVDAIKNAIQWNPNLNAVLIGDGPQMGELKKKIRQDGLEDNILLKGHLRREEVVALMAQSKVLAHPARYESFGMVLVEALACGMHILSFETGIAAERAHWHIARDKEDFLRLLPEILQGSLDFAPVITYDIADTAHSYHQLYDSLL